MQRSRGMDAVAMIAVLNEREIAWPEALQTKYMKNHFYIFSIRITVRSPFDFIFCSKTLSAELNVGDECSVESE